MISVLLLTALLSELVLGTIGLKELSALGVNLVESIPLFISQSATAFARRSDIVLLKLAFPLLSV